MAGGVSAILLPENIINDCKMHMLSADGRCKTFDAQGDGYVPGEGCGIILLKRLSDAVQVLSTGQLLHREIPGDEEAMFRHSPIVTR